MRLALEGQSDRLEASRDQPDKNPDLNNETALAIEKIMNIVFQYRTYRDTPLRRQVTKVAHHGVSSCIGCRVGRRLNSGTSRH